MSFRKEHVLSALLGSAATLLILGAVSCQDVQPAGVKCIGGLPPYQIPEPSDPESGLAKLSDVDRRLPLAVVNKVEIPLAELQDRLDKQSPYVRAKYVEVPKRKELLDQIIQFEVLSQAAADAGYGSNPDVLRQTKQAMIQKYLEGTFNKQFTVDSIKDDEVSKYYDEHKEEYNKPEQVRAAHIVVADQAKAQALLTEALAKKDDAKAWKTIVETNSLDEETKTKGGDLGYFSADDAKLDALVRDAAFKLQNNGEMVVVQNSKGQWVVVKFMSRRKELKRDLETVKPQIKQKLFQDRKKTEFEKFAADLKGKVPVTANESALSKLVITSTGGPATPGIPGMPGAPGAPGGPTMIKPALPEGMTPVVPPGATLTPEAPTNISPIKPTAITPTPTPAVPANTDQVKQSKP
jgi:peptidyl-prolyl cis-trans isomerase C